MGTPVRDLVIIVAARNAGARHQKQNLWQGIPHLGRVMRVSNLSKVLEKKAKAILDDHPFH
jgi:hypothetical protein